MEEKEGQKVNVEKNCGFFAIHAKRAKVGSQESVMFFHPSTPKGRAKLDNH